MDTSSRVTTVNRRTQIICACAAIVGLQLLLCGSALFESGISPYDDLMFANNGMFFLGAFQDIGHVLSGPKEWMWNYYNQYPALFLRRHPPLFGLIESAVFAVTGPSLIAAKLLVFVFAAVWVLAWFALLVFAVDSVVLAAAGAIAIATLPMALELSSAIRVDIPSAAFLLLACLAGRNLVHTKSYRAALLTAGCIVASLYTYQLSVFGAAALVLSCGLPEIRAVIRGKRNDLLLLGATTFALMLPLAAITLLFAQDNLAGIASEAPKEFAPFIPVKSQRSLEYWMFYLKVMGEHFPLALAGLAVWVAAKVKAGFQRRDLFFVLWFVLGYIGLSCVPSKGDRYAFHFATPALALGVIGLSELLTQFATRRNVRSSIAAAACALVLAVNVRLGMARDYELAGGLGAAAEQLLAQKPSARILYCGALSPLFIYEVRSRDPQRKASVLRCDSELEKSASLGDVIAARNVSYVAVESQSLRTDERAQFEKMQSDIRTLLDRGVITRVGEAPITKGHRHREQAYQLLLYQKAE